MASPVMSCLNFKSPNKPHEFLTESPYVFPWFPIELPRKSPDFPPRQRPPRQWRSSRRMTSTFPVPRRSVGEFHLRNGTPWRVYCLVSHPLTWTLMEGSRWITGSSQLQKHQWINNKRNFWLEWTLGMLTNFRAPKFLKQHHWWDDRWTFR